MNPLRLSGEKQRCWWCGKSIAGEPQQVIFHFGKKDYQTMACCEEHAQCVIKTYRRVSRILPFFLICLLISFVLIVGGDFFGWGKHSVFAGFAFLAVTVFVCPCATPQTVELMGLRKSIILVRVVGLIGVTIPFVLKAFF